MPSITWGTGTDIFAADYLSEQVPNSGSSEWQSSDIYDNMLSALELKRMSGHFDAGVDTTTGSSTPADTPFSLVTEGASTGYYRTIKYSSQYADDYFFSQNVLMYDRHIITNVSDIQRLVWTPTVSEYNFDNAAMWDGTTSNIKCYVISQFESNKVDILKKGKTDEYTTTGVDIIPAIISPDSVNHLQGFNYWNRNSETVTWVDRQIGRYNQTYGSGSDNVARYCPVFGNQSAIILPNSSGETSKWAIDDTGNYAVRFTYKAADQYSYLWTTYCQAKYWICSKDELLHVLARSGMRFIYNNTMYKPVAENGVIIGYTDDMDKESEWDNWHDYTDHEVPITPPAPEPGDDDDPSDDQGWGGAYSGAGAFSKFYLCTATDLANLRTWFGGGGGGDPIPDGFDPMGQVLGLLQYPVSISGTALAPDEITFRSGKTIVHTGVNADRSTGGFLHLDCGSVKIPRRMQERGVPFLDFETSLEIYVPFCGTAPLDVQTCVGKTLTCDMYVATATGDVSAVIAAGGHPVAYMSGNMAESLPISSSGYGMYLAACKSTWGNGVSQVMNQLTGGTTSTIKNVNQAALNETLSYSQTGGWGHSELLAESYNNPAIGRGMAGAASAKGAAAIGLTTTALNVANAASTGYEQYQRVKNASYTSVSGSFTSCAAWNYPFTPYVKITRPHKQIPDNYKHTAAIPLVETRSLSGAPGLTTCVNPDVSGIANATAQEKDIIYRALVNGVIV